MSNKSVLYVIIAVLLVSLFVSLTNRKEVVIERTLSDTVFIERIDTSKTELPKSKKDTIIDTLYVYLPSEPSNTLRLPITQRYYYEKDKYEAWVSGYNPQLDSLNVYNKNKITTITNNITKEVYPKRTDLYVNVGGMYIGDRFVPKLGAGLKLKNDMIINTNFGIYNKKVFYELTFSLKINEK